MTQQEYQYQVLTKFSNIIQINMNGLNTFLAYEEVFNWKWFGTKLKISSFLTCVDKIDVNLIKSYSENCLDYARKNIKGLPLGCQNAVVSYSILVSDTIDPSAISFASKRPNKHYSAFEIPIIVDLSKQELYYYKGKITWGAVYHSFFNDYIVRNFK